MIIHLIFFALTISSSLIYRLFMSQPSRLLDTVPEVIDALGGAAACSKIFGGVPSRFYNYRSFGRFPDAMHMRIYCECMKRGLSIAPELVGMTPDVMAMARGERQRRLPIAAE